MLMSIISDTPLVFSAHPIKIDVASKSLLYASRSWDSSIQPQVTRSFFVRSLACPHRAGET
eukprot:NODE_4738_length_770_cov_2.295423_g3947_i0.p3 GENE.NODE_4738_length_770_cov_2.295423_g3947_i0~~NODE_4738_length_770_cov_2.295423_g3947_i0.p3  ORF type:complete len:61 (-),score=3.90 NODE_4738_length_770_cov_2.295423_g3947_i0:49-231(-)